MTEQRSRELEITNDCRIVLLDREVFQATAAAIVASVIVYFLGVPCDIVTSAGRVGSLLALDCIDGVFL
jgi:hypothetical protein